MAFLGAPGTLSAQETRAAQADQKRAEKAKQLRRYRRGRVERALLRIEDRLIVQRIFNPPRGVFARFGGLTEGAGFGGGPAYRYSTDLFRFTTSSAISMRGYWLVEGSLAFPTLADGHAFAEITARRRNFPQEDFFGLGPESTLSDRTNYALRETSFGGKVGVSPVSWLRASSDVEYSTPRIGSGTDKRSASTEDVFTDRTAPGLFAQPDFLRTGARAVIDYTDEPLRPRVGGRYIVAVDHFSDRDFDRYSFNRWSFELQQYVPIVDGARTLALRALMTSLSPVDGHEVPFYLQPTIGGAYTVRGLTPFRLRDRNALLLQAEYRWEINPFVSGAIFYDAGKVASGREDLDFSDMKKDYGFGLRMGSSTGVAIRAEMAFGSGEGRRIILRFNNVF